MVELGGYDSSIPVAGVTVLPVKERFGQELSITPGKNQASFDIAISPRPSAVHFLDYDHSFCKDSNGQTVRPQSKSLLIPLGCMIPQPSVVKGMISLQR